MAAVAYVMHPLSSSDFWQPPNTRTATGLMASAPPLKRQRAQHLPPGLDEVQVGRITRLEDELPARARPRTQQDLGSWMRTQVVHDSIDRLHVWGNSGLHSLQEVRIVRCGASRIGCSQRFSIGRLERSKDIALTAAPIVNLLDRRPTGLADSLGPIAVVGTSFVLAEVAAGMGSSRAGGAEP
jgi:hypothetical protein